jgi:hypothetical protein
LKASTTRIRLTCPQPLARGTDVTIKLDGMSVPADNRLGPNCGVTAVAVLAGVSFQTAWDQIALIANRDGKWKGGTRHSERLAALNLLGVRYTEIHIPRKMRLRTVAAWTMTTPGVRYMVRTTGHVQVIRDGIVLDQAGPVAAALHWGRNKLVSNITRIDS